MRLHIGSGPVVLDGWLNIDNQPYPGVNHVLDATRDLPFEDVEFIFAEHFLEHLPLDSGFRFLQVCRKVLNPDGVLRIATPNLDWVWLTHYRHPATLTTEEALQACLEINRAFHGWGHRFLFNGSTLTAALRSAGFDSVEFRSYGQSSRPELCNLERHPRAPDHADASHVLVVEASGVAQPSTAFPEFATPYLRDFVVV